MLAVKPKYNAVGGATKWYMVRVKTFRPTTGGINICLMNQHNECVLKRLEPPFDKGVREDTFEAADIGDVVAVMAAPETGSWGLAEIAIDNKRVFDYNKVIGGRDADSDMAAHLTIARPILTLEQKLEWDAEYKQLKDTLMVGTAQAAVFGTFVTGFALGTEKAAAFATGGAMALLYGAMLQMEVDTIGKGNKALSSSIVRLASLFALSAAMVNHFHDNIQADNGIFVMALTGFMSYKACVLRVGMR